MFDADENKDGRISRDELLEHYRQVYADTLPDAEIVKKAGRSRVAAAAAVAVAVATKNNYARAAALTNCLIILHLL